MSTVILSNCQRGSSESLHAGSVFSAPSNIYGRCLVCNALCCKSLHQFGCNDGYRVQGAKVSQSEATRIGSLPSDTSPWTSQVSGSVPVADASEIIASPTNWRRDRAASDSMTV